jgi:uncharacterized protein with PIN domain
MIYVTYLSETIQTATLGECLRFITDGMLGKLTRWLRMLGHDVVYARDMEDMEILDLAKGEQRCLLTRDSELCRRAKNHNVEALFVDGRNDVDRLVSVSKRIGLDLDVDPDVSRCPVCNGEIQPVEKNSVLDELLPTTAASYERFWRCAQCRKVFWQGTHWTRIKQTFSEAKKRSR